MAHGTPMHTEQRDFNTCVDTILLMMLFTLKVPVWMTNGEVLIPMFQPPTSIKMLQIDPILVPDHGTVGNDDVFDGNEKSVLSKTVLPTLNVFLRQKKIKINC